MPSGSQADHVWVANWDPALGPQNHGGTNGLLRNPGGNYTNGTAPAREFYIRLQVYFTADFAWAGDPKTDIYEFSSGNCFDTKILFYYPPEGLEDPTSASYDAGPFTACGIFDPGPPQARFADALMFRYGNTSDNFKHFPADHDASFNPRHMEYMPYQSLTLRNPNDQTIFGRTWRFNTNRWYTLEWRTILSDPGVSNGTVEAWIDGTKIYSASDLATCGGGLGGCDGLGAIIITAYHNGADPTVWDGQMVIDNLVISRSYVGPPSTSGPPSTPGLVASYGFNEGTGATTADASGNGFTGTLVNGPVWTAGRYGNALQFNATDDGNDNNDPRVVLGRDLNFALPFTISAWVNPVNFTDWRAIFSKRDSASPADMRFDIGLSSGSGSVYIYTANSWLDFNYIPPVNTWTHLAVVAQASGTELYVNGTLQQTLGAITLGTDSTANTVIGGTGEGTDGDNDPFNGLIDELRLYSRALTQTEIQDDMNTPVGGTP